MGNTKPGGWHTEDIKAALRKKHGALTTLSRTWGLHPHSISTCLVPGSYWPTLEARIADELGVTPHTLWPDRWRQDGTYLTETERNLTPVVPPAHRPNRKVA
jgi:Ner family transcriptional regulator